MSEIDIQNEIRIALSQRGIVIFRNNLGVLQDKKGNFVRYGLGNPGGSDLIGLTPEGRFIAIEVKIPSGKVTEDQENFLNVIKKNGGISGVARSVEEALEICGLI